MASKLKLNGFSLFMRDRRRQLEEEKGEFPGGWKDVATALDNEWKELGEQQRENYRQRAKKMDEVPLPMPKPCVAEGGDTDGRKTSLGMTYQEVKDRRYEMLERVMDHNAELKRVMEHGDPKELTFVIINFSIYGQLLHKTYVPVEMGLTAFNVKNGIIDNYCTLIDPYEIPKGLGIDARKATEVLSVPYPPFDNRLQNYIEIVMVLEKFINRHTHHKLQNRKVYCLQNEMQVNQGCLDWMYSQLADHENNIQLHSLGEAVRMLSNIGVTNRARRENRGTLDVISDLILERQKRDMEMAESSGSITSGYMKSTSGCNNDVSSSVSSGQGGSIMKDVDYAKIKAGVFYHERQVEDYLNTLNFAYEGEIGCLYHYNKDEGVQHCALNITNRYAYNILDVMITVYSVKPSVHFHFPGIRSHAMVEMDRRNEMLSFWGTTVYTDDDLTFDPRQRDPKAVTFYPDFGPSRPE